MSIAKLKLGKESLAIGLLFFSLSAFSEGIAPPVKEECVGRYEITLPADVEVALSTPDSLSDDVKDPIRFSDGQTAPHSKFIYNGGFTITDSVQRRLFDERVAPTKKSMQPKTGSQNASKFRPYPVAHSDASGWIGKTSIGFDLYAGGRIFSYIETSYTGMNAAQQHVDSITKNFSTRSLFEMPTGVGVCLPYSFIKDGGSDANRQIGVTYRLVSHPDVTIFFLDEKALTGDPKLTSKQENEFVWGYEYGIGKRIKLHGPMPYRSVTLDGREGIATSATITRDDDSTDYGYLATVQGDPNAPVDTPNLLLLVERNAKHAKGNPPVSAEELDQMAKDIAASIKRRPTQ